MSKPNFSKMLTQTISIYFLLLVATTWSANLERKREGKMFGYRYTSTKIVPKLVTTLLPSSCVQVEPSLPPCRSVRQLDEFPRFFNGKVYTLDTNTTLDPNGYELISTIETTQLGWGEYLGLYAPTVTVNAVYLETTTVLDPRTVVTFSVKGCKPSRLPLDLDPCPAGEIKPTPTKDQITTTTVHHDSLLDKGPVTGINIQNNNLEMIQPTEEQIPEVKNNATEKLKTKPK